ncbi:MAG: hypothetical protein MUF19_01315 [Candidatus Pacebacteria bacterium]|jgi:hypothetical protein|nr:hypothetical protein [Candidatus Paceibacterota bacterium]
MLIFTRVCLFVATALLVLYGAVEIALVLVAVSSIFFAAYEYMFMGFCIDCYFAPEPYTFWYTLIMTGLVVIGILLQPFIHTRKDI